MDMHLRKLNFVQEFLRLKNEQIVNKLVDILHQEKKKLYTKEIKPMSMEEFNNIIIKAEENSAQGKLTEANKLMKDIKTWT